MPIYIYKRLIERNKNEGKYRNKKIAIPLFAKEDISSLRCASDPKISCKSLIILIKLLI